MMDVTKVPDAHRATNTPYMRGPVRRPTQPRRQNTATQ